MSWLLLALALAHTESKRDDLVECAAHLSVLLTSLHMRTAKMSHLSNS